MQLDDIGAVRAATRHQHDGAGARHVAQGEPASAQRGAQTTRTATGESAGAEGELHPFAADGDVTGRQQRGGITHETHHDRAGVLCRRGSADCAADGRRRRYGEIGAQIRIAAHRDVAEERIQTERIEHRMIKAQRIAPGGYVTKRKVAERVRDFSVRKALHTVRGDQLDERTGQWHAADAVPHGTAHRDAAHGHATPRDVERGASPCLVDARRDRIHRYDARYDARYDMRCDTRCDTPLLRRHAVRAQQKQEECQALHRDYIVGWYRPHTRSSVSATSPTLARARTASIIRGMSSRRAPTCDGK